MAETKWTTEQEQVIAAKDCNLLVAAAAGAGKTAVLVERIIRKITQKEHPIDIDKLLVVTFTKAAATEMRERIAEAISSFLDKNPASKGIQRQLILLNKASITTIHSFCLEVIRGHFQNIDLDPGFRIADETEVLLLKTEVLQELFEDLYENETEIAGFFELLESYGGNRDDQVLQEMVYNLYNFTQSSPWPQKWLQEISAQFYAPDGIDFSKTRWGQVLLDSVQITLAGLQQNMNRAVKIISHSNGLDKYLPVFSDEVALITQMMERCEKASNTKWDDLYRIFQFLAYSRLPSAAKDADKEQQEIVKQIRDDTKKQLNKLKENIFSAESSEIFADLKTIAPLMHCLTQLVITFSQKYAEKKRAKSVVDFNDLEHFCLEILSEQDGEGKVQPSPVALTYRQRFQEILVDEYQDSNLVQEFIIQMISKADVEMPNVFMVGDVKQSIYRFRQAKPELFLEKYHAYSTDPSSRLRKILLFKNFRSRKEVVGAVNELFQQIMSVTVGELDYTEEEALNPGAAFPDPVQNEQIVGGAVEFHLIQTENEPRKTGAGSEKGEEEQAEDNMGEEEEEEMLDSIQCEARLVARRIRGLLETDDQGRFFAIYDKQNKEYRKVAYKDIVILLRTTKNWADVFRDEFVAAGIPAFADTGSGFLKTTEVQVILSLLQIIDNPLQDIPLLAVLRSPLASFTTEELAELRLSKRKAPLFEALQTLVQVEINEQEEQEEQEPERNEDQKQQQQQRQKLALALEKNDSAREKAIKFYSKLRRWQEKSLYLSTDQLLWQIYTETGYYSIVGAMPAGEQRQANLRILFERARQYEETSYKGLFNFINFIDQLKTSKGDMGSAKILGENDNVVRIMSIHKSKGLEFPVVILAGCGKKFNLQDMNKRILLHQDLGLGPDVVDYRLRLAFPSLPKQAIREKIRMETLSEEMRILYVALTRAREKLIVTGAVSDIVKAKVKWLRCAEVEKNRIPIYDILKGERYLDWIGPILMRASSAWQMQLWNRQDVSDLGGGQEQQEDTDFSQWLEGLEDSLKKGAEEENSLGEKGEVGKEIQRRLSWQYSYSPLSKVPAKVSVTELKRRFEEQYETPEYTLKMKKPLFLEEKKGLSAAEVGTVMHFVMQHLDFSPQDAENERSIEKQIQRLIEKDLLTRQQAESIAVNKIITFTNSLLGKRMLASDSVHREVPFNIEIPCEEVYPVLAEQGYSENILLQGIIDCYFEEADGLVLVDYKTDEVPKGGSETLRARYETQIAYYTRALEQLTQKKVKEKVIYLFDNGEILRY